MILKNNKRIDGCSDTVPIGTLNPFLGSTAPYGYLICQGQKVSKTVYKELYEICGDTFGQSTDTEFYLPDLRGQTIAGYKEGDSTFGTLGGLIGSLTHLHSTGNHTLTVAEMPSHNHVDGIGGIQAVNGGGAGWTKFVGTASPSTTGSTGGGQAHNHGDTSSTSSVQPTTVLNWIVKAFQLMPNQSYVSTVSQDSNTNTYSCNYINDKIVPTGGTTGQVLAKKSDTNNDVEWIDQTGGSADYDSLPVGSVVEYEGDTVPVGYEQIKDTQILWTNPNPTAEISSDTQITLSSGDYDYIKIFSRLSLANNYCFTIDVLKGYGTRLYYGGNYRPIDRNNNTSFTIKPSSDGQGNVMIPQYIVGYKTGLFS